MLSSRTTIFEIDLNIKYSYSVDNLFQDMKSHKLNFFFKKNHHENRDLWQGELTLKNLMTRCVQHDKDFQNFIQLQIALGGDSY